MLLCANVRWYAASQHGRGQQIQWASFVPGVGLMWGHQHNCEDKEEELKVMQIMADRLALTTDNWKAPTSQTLSQQPAAWVPTGTCSRVSSSHRACMWGREAHWDAGVALGFLTPFFPQTLANQEQNQTALMSAHGFHLQCILQPCEVTSQYSELFLYVLHLETKCKISDHMFFCHKLTWPHPCVLTNST